MKTRHEVIADLADLVEEIADLTEDNRAHNIFWALQRVKDPRLLDDEFKLITASVRLQATNILNQLKNEHPENAGGYRNVSGDKKD